MWYEASQSVTKSLRYSCLVDLRYVAVVSKYGTIVDTSSRSNPKMALLAVGPRVPHAFLPYRVLTIMYTDGDVLLSVSLLGPGGLG